MGIVRIVKSLCPILHASDDMKNTFGDEPIVAFRKPRNLGDEIVRSRLKNVVVNKGMRKCDKSRCKICEFVEEGSEFEGVWS